MTSLLHDLCNSIGSMKRFGFSDVKRIGFGGVPVGDGVSDEGGFIVFLCPCLAKK